MIIDVMGLPMFPNEFSEEQFKIAAKQYCSGNREKVIDLLDKMIPLYTTTFVNRDYFLCNYSAPIEVSPIGMSDHLTVLQQQELHCISNFRSS